MTDYGEVSGGSSDYQGSDADPDVDEAAIRTHENSLGEQRVTGIEDALAELAESDRTADVQRPEKTGETTLSDWEQA